MGTILAPLSAVFGGIGFLLIGNSLLGTLLSVRTVTLGYAPEVSGLVMAAYFLGFIVGSIHCVSLIERAGHIRTFAALASVASAASLSYLLIESPIAWAVFRIVTGYCVAGLFMVSESWLNERSDNTNRGRVLSIYMLVNLIALALGQFLLMLPEPGGYELFCISSILISLGLVPLALTRTVAPIPPRAKPMRPRALFAASPLGMVGCFASGMVMSAFWAMAPIFARQYGLTDSGIAVFMSATILGGLISIVPVGRLSDRYDRRLVITAVCLASGLASVALALQGAGNLPVLLVLTALFGATSFPIYSLAVAHTNDYLERDDMVPASSGLLMTYGIGAIIGPVGAGAVMGWLGNSGLYFSLACATACIFVFALLRMTLRPAVAPEAKDPIQPAPRTTHVAFELDPRAPEQDEDGQENEQQDETATAEETLQNTLPTR